LPIKQALFIAAGIRLLNATSQLRAHWIKRAPHADGSEACIVSRRCGRAIYTPFLSAAGLES